MLQGWQQVRSPTMPGLAFKDHKDHKSRCKQGLGGLAQLWEDMLVLFILHGSQTAIPSPTLIVSSSSKSGWQLHCLLPAWCQHNPAPATPGAGGQVPISFLAQGN